MQAAVRAGKAALKEFVLTPIRSSSLRISITGDCDSAEQPAAELYNAVLDPTEHQNYTAQNPQIVTQLTQLVAKYWATGVPQQTSNPNCPPFKPHQSSHGPYVAPWC